MKVWGIVVMNCWGSCLGPNSQARLIVKAHSMAEAVRVCKTLNSGMTGHFFRGYASVTGNALDLALTDGDYVSAWAMNINGPVDACLRLYDARRTPAMLGALE